MYLACLFNVIGFLENIKTKNCICSVIKTESFLGQKGHIHIAVAKLRFQNGAISLQILSYLLPIFPILEYLPHLKARYNS